MEKFDTYLGLCTEVYDISKPSPPEDAYKFYRSYASEVNGLILEPMCGTGRFLLPLLEEGFNIHGFDASDHMLQALHNKATRKNLKPNIWKGFVEDLASSERYDLIFIPSGSFCLLTDQVVVKSSLKIFYDHLSEGGVFLFEGETFNSIPPVGIWRGSKWLRDDGKMIISSFCAFLEDNVSSVLGKYELVDGNRIIHTEIEEYKIRLYKKDELIKLLKQVGFSQVRAIKAFDRSAEPDEDDESIVYECRK